MLLSLSGILFLREKLKNLTNQYVVFLSKTHVRPKSRSGNVKENNTSAHTGNIYSRSNCLPTKLREPVCCSPNFLLAETFACELKTYSMHLRCVVPVYLCTLLSKPYASVVYLLNLKY